MLVKNFWRYKGYREGQVWNGSTSYGFMSTPMKSIYGHNFLIISTGPGSYVGEDWAIKRT